MSKNFSLDFDGFLDLAEEIDSLGETYLKKATVRALEESRKYINIEVGKAMKESPYSFKATGSARQSLIDVSKMEVKEPTGTIVEAWAGVDLAKAPEALILAYGTPHIQKDQKLYNAIKVKGNVKKNLMKLQSDIFNEELQRGRQ